MRQDPRTRFYAKVKKTDTCWLWKGGVAGSYGTFSYEGRAQNAHRVAWQLEHGPIPDGMVVRHICDVKMCVRPDHLCVGTQKDNVADSILRNRRRTRSRRRGSIHQHTPSTYRLRVEVAPYADGRRRWVTRTVRGSHADAEDALARLIVEVADGFHQGEAGTLNRLVSAWLEKASPDLEARTVETYRYLTRSYLTDGIGERQFARIRAADLDRFYAGLVAQGLSPATVRKIHSMIRRAFSQAIKWNWVVVNPAAHATPPAARPAELVVPSGEDVQRLLDAVDDTEFRALIRLAASSGARRGELCALRWCDVDFDAKTLRIAGSVISVAGRTSVKATKTRQIRVITLDDITLRHLAAVKAIAAERLLSFGVVLDPAMFVFPAELAPESPIRPDVISHRFGRLVKKAGLSGIRFHDLRHFHVTQLLGNGVDVGTVADRVGHKNAAMTLNVYRHFMPAADQRAADVIAAVLGGEGRSGIGR